MSDYFFYDLNKKMADLANKQQLAETAQATPVKPAPSALRTQLNERDMGKHNNANTGFAALAKKTGGGEKGAKIAGAQLAKMRAKGQVEEDSVPPAAKASASKSSSSKPSDSDYRIVVGKDTGPPPKKPANPLYPDSIPVDEPVDARFRKKPTNEEYTEESAFQAAIGKKKYGEQGMKALQKAGRDHASAKTMSNIRNKYDKYDESMTDEGNAFSGAVVKAKADGVQPGEKITVGGKQYPVKEAAKYRDPKYKDKLYTQNPPEDDADTSLDTYYNRVKPTGYQGAKRLKGGDEYSRTDPLTRGFGRSGTGSPVEKGPRKGLPKRDQITSLKGSIKDVLGKHTEPNLPEGGAPMTPKQKKFAALAKPFDKITFADKIVGAKKEVDEMLGDVAATAMKNAVGKMRGRNRDMEEGFLDDEPTSRRSSTGGRIDTSEPGVTRHRAVKGNYSGAGHDASADDNDEPSGQIGRRKVGAGMGKKIGAKINRGTSKLMTKEGDMPEDMIEPQDSGEYDQEGDMAKDTIKTVVRHAQALEKILGDDDNLPEWVQSKLAKIENMMTAVDDYMQNQQDDEMPMEEERTNKRDNRAERAGRKVAKDIEYDEKKKDGIHGRRRGSEDSKAERAGKRVTKDIEYDEKKDKKKEVDETTTSGSVATGSAPKSGSSHNYGKGIYDSLNRQLENMISEGMNINMSMNNDDHGGPKKSLTVTATDEDAVMLSSLLKMAGLGNDDDHMHDMTDDDSQMLAIQTMGDEDACSSCGSSPCGCDDQMMDEDRWGAEQPPKLPNDMTVTADGGVDVKKSGSDWVYKSKEPGGRVTVTIPAKAANKMLPNTEMDEAYGDTDATENEPDYPTDEEGTDDAMMYSGGLNGPKSTGQTTIPVIAGQDDRMGYNGDNELRRMMEIAGLR